MAIYNFSMTAFVKLVGGMASFSHQMKLETKLQKIKLLAFGEFTKQTKALYRLNTYTILQVQGFNTLNKGIH